MRALGFEPKKEEIKKMISDIDKDGSGTYVLIRLSYTYNVLKINTVICTQQLLLFRTCSQNEPLNMILDRRCVLPYLAQELIS